MGAEYHRQEIRVVMDRQSQLEPAGGLAPSSGSRLAAGLLDEVSIF